MLTDGINDPYFKGNHKLYGIGEKIYKILSGMRL